MKTLKWKTKDKRLSYAQGLLQHPAVIARPKTYAYILREVQTTDDLLHRNGLFRAGISK